jgi:hypothetical protein
MFLRAKKLMARDIEDAPFIFEFLVKPDGKTRGGGAWKRGFFFGAARTAGLGSKSTFSSPTPDTPSVRQ